MQFRVKRLLCKSRSRIGSVLRCLEEHGGKVTSGNSLSASS